jgi:hypothetical protein
MEIQRKMGFPKARQRNERCGFASGKPIAFPVLIAPFVGFDVATGFLKSF